MVIYLNSRLEKKFNTNIWLLLELGNVAEYTNTSTNVTFQTKLQKLIRNYLYDS